jgi:hypothetical protein
MRIGIKTPATAVANISPGLFFEACQSAVTAREYRSFPDVFAPRPGAFLSGCAAEPDAVAPTASRQNIIHVEHKS